MPNAVNRVLAEVSTRPSTNSSKQIVVGNTILDLDRMEVRVTRSESAKDKEMAIKAAGILKASFKVSEQWIEVFMLLAKNRGMSGEEVFQCVVKAVDRITFSSPTPAEVLGDREAIKLYSYRDVEYLVHQGKGTWKDYGIVRYPEGGIGIIFGKVTDMLSAGIPILPPKSL